MKLGHLSFLMIIFTLINFNILNRSVENVLDEKQSKRLINAVQTGKIDIARKLLETDPNLVNAKDESGKPLIFWAAYINSPALIDLLVKYGIDVNQNIGAQNALYYALANNSHQAVKSLLTHGAEINPKQPRTKNFGPLLIQAIDEILKEQQDNELKIKKDLNEHVFSDISQIISQYAKPNYIEKLKQEREKVLAELNK